MLHRGLSHQTGANSDDCTSGCSVELGKHAVVKRVILRTSSQAYPFQLGTNRLIYRAQPSSFVQRCNRPGRRGSVN